MNAFVTSVNNLYKTTIEEKYSKQARFVDLDAIFSGHRFCERGMNHEDQFDKDTKGSKVYLWNLQFDVAYGTNADDTAYENGTLSADRAKTLIGENDNVTAWSPSGEVNKPEYGWRLRPLHPKYRGYTTIKNSILAQLKKDGLPKAEKVMSPTTKPPTPGTDHGATAAAAATGTKVHRLHRP